MSVPQAFGLPALPGPPTAPPPPPKWVITAPVKTAPKAKPKAKVKPGGKKMTVPSTEVTVWDVNPDKLLNSSPLINKGSAGASGQGLDKSNQGLP